MREASTSRVALGPVRVRGGVYRGLVLHVLDIDLDFFLDDVADSCEPDGPRLDSDEYSPWSLADTMAFLQDRCGLDRKVPGFAVEHHREVFVRWRDAILRGDLTPPFQVTHVDAHADLGMGDSGYIYLMTRLVFEAPEDRLFPETGTQGLGDGNWLAFALACRWISSLVYVYNRDEDEPNDIFAHVMKGFNPRGDCIELVGMNKDELDKVVYYTLGRGSAPVILQREPPVPFRPTKWRDFKAAEKFDLVCLARSPAYTPAESDALFDAIRERFIDKAAFR